MSVPGYETMSVQLCSPGTMERCAVCEPLAAEAVSSGPLSLDSGRRWAVVPCTRELVYICLNCGNTLRTWRAE